MNVDYARIAQIVRELRPLDEYEAYYVKDTVQAQRIGPLVPNIGGILRNLFHPSARVLDIGCGCGHTLLENAGLYQWGVGLDESAAYMIAKAKDAQTAKGIRNVEFQYGKAIDLPFPDEAFDLVFSERGPLGHQDETLAEAMRVLRQGGMILVETGGGFETLKTEKARFERLGVDVQLAATFTERLIFPDAYEFFRHYCVSWTTYDAARTLDPSDKDAIDRILVAATDAQGAMFYRWSRILVGGRKAWA